MRELIRLRKSDNNYPVKLKQYLNESAPDFIDIIGNRDLLNNNNLMALFCSVKCPGNLILQIYDFIQSSPNTDIAFIGGFHSMIEKECLRLISRKNNPIIYCPAKNIENMKLNPVLKKLLEENRLLILSPFDKRKNRISKNNAIERNRFISALADSIIVTYAEKGGKIEFLSKEILQWNKPIFTFDTPGNAHLIKLGVKPIK